MYYLLDRLGKFDTTQVQHFFIIVIKLLQEPSELFVGQLVGRSVIISYEGRKVTLPALLPEHILQLTFFKTISSASMIFPFLSVLDNSES